MLRSVVCFLFTPVLVISTLNLASAQSSPKPISASVLMALQAGNSLPANIVDDIHQRGLTFHSDSEYREQLKRAGADENVLKALDNAKTVEPIENLKAEKELIRQLSSSGALIRDKHYDEAVAELSKALQGSFAGPEAGFVMAELLREQEDWQQSAAVYAQILRQSPDFPELHTKVSFVLYRLNDDDSALHEAKVALAINPRDAEAHKNAGLALAGLAKYEAAASEYKQALAIKPDYAPVHFDLGIMYQNMHEYENAIAEYRKSIALDPNNADVHTNLGNVYREKGEIGLAISEQREAKRLKPNDPSIRQNLASVLMSQNPNDAITELQEMEKLFPEFELCHLCLAQGLLWRGDKKAAEIEFQKAIQLDPSDPEPHRSLGGMHESEKEYDVALEEYRQAEKLAPYQAQAHLDLGRVLLAKNDVTGALEELKQAESMSESDWKIHDAYGAALQAAKQNDAAISEFKEAIALDPKQPHVIFELASAFEAKGDWVNALEQYRRASLTESSMNRDHRPGDTFYFSGEAEHAYPAAQKRFSEHLQALKAAGRNAEAKDLESQANLMSGFGDAATKVQMAIQSGDQAATQHKYDECEKLYKQALELAEHLPPGDVNLLEALKKMGDLYQFTHRYSDADAAFHHELANIEKAYGPDSERATDPLYSLASLAYVQKNHAEEVRYLSRSLEINLKLFGENNERTEDNLRRLGGAYMAQNEWPKAEPFFLRAVTAAEVMDGPESFGVMVSLPLLCDLYDHWSRPDKSQPCWHRTTLLMEAQSGNDDPNMAPYIDAEANALRQLGRTVDADQLEQRSARLKQAKMQTN